MVLRRTWAGQVEDDPSRVECHLVLVNDETIVVAACQNCPLVLEHEVMLSHDDHVLVIDGKTLATGVVWMFAV